MDFFAQQDRARRNTRLLLLFFMLAIAVLVLLTNALAAAFYWISGEYNVYAGGTGWAGFLAQFSWERFATISFFVTSAVGVVSMIHWVQLAGGGKAVAESVGGRQVVAGSDDFDEQRCHNIVQELALAANMPVPALYVLPDERGINAFAAGTQTTNAVVAVTRGALRQLNREEMQGVIGHEFSHILNGDMRLGIRLAALLKGITFVGDVGHMLLRAGSYSSGFSNRRNDSSAALPLIGLGLLLVGSIGAFAAGCIKAAISRQKEYLADASAVQFTRDSRGIADALKVIGGFIPGSLVHAARAQEMSHIYFGEVTHSIWNTFSTHPPLEKRIRRLDGDWDGQFIERREHHYKSAPDTEAEMAAGVGREALTLAALASISAAGATTNQPLSSTSASIGAEGSRTEDGSPSIPNQPQLELKSLVEDPLGAEALIFSLLMARDPSQQAASLQLLEEKAARGVSDQVQDVLPAVSHLEPGQRFPLVACAIPTLKMMSTPQYRQFKSTLLALIRVDQTTDLFEWCLFQLVRHHLDGEFLQVRESRPRIAHLAKARAPLRIVLSVLAHQGEGDSNKAFAVAAETLDLQELTLLPLEECAIADFSRSVHSLADCYPLLKPRILKAMALAAADDGAICHREIELVVAVAAVMDCPVPPDFDLAVDLRPT
ncbi:MAG: M48 family metallopeptidase [Pseudomonadota bacterium]